MAETAVKSETKPKAAPKESKPKADSGSKSDAILNAIVNHITRNGSDADDALLAELHKLSGGKVGQVARGTVDEDADA